ncbi:Ser/Thr protein phosphatase family protein [Aphelenchoides avenae]|nr:Ser/Thr protein phosphatase family protein [Aphelenchus avenae]
MDAVVQDFETAPAVSDVPPPPRELSDMEFVDSLIRRLMSAPPRGNLNEVEVSVPATDIDRLCRLAVAALREQPSRVDIPKSHLPATICGDLHGQFRDLRLIIAKCGDPSRHTWVFMGDYVDRGCQGVETDYTTNLVYGFFHECLQKYGKDVGEHTWLMFLNVFNHLPFVAYIAGCVLAMHGGLSPDLRTLDDINRIARPTLVPLFGLACDLVWSDPDSELRGWAMNKRGISFTYDDSVVHDFCNKHRVELIVRGHQIHSEMQSSGYKTSANGRLVTVFSAPNYLNNGNTGAVLNISAELVCQFQLFRPRKPRRRQR